MAYGNPAIATAADVELIREDLRQHAEQDREDFKGVRQEMGILRDTQNQYLGALYFVKWTLGIGLPAIFALLIALLVRGH